MAHMRKALARRRVQALPPRGMRPKLDRSQQTDLALVHMLNLDLVVKGQADEIVMWHLAEQALLWSRVAQLTGYLQDEMTQQLNVAAEVIRRFGRTGKVGFSGQEYQIAKEGTEVMDCLAGAVDKHVAVAAANWAELAMFTVRAESSLAPLVVNLRKTVCDE